MNTPPSNEDYLAFLRSKVAIAGAIGFEIDNSEINPILKPHQRAIVRWAIAGGRRAIFAAFGLGKSIIQLEIVRIIMARTGGFGLIVIPLGVRQEFIRDAAMLGVVVQFIRDSALATDPSVLYLTNYESVREGKIDPRHFVVASLDEAAGVPSPRTLSPWKVGALRVLAILELQGFVTRNDVRKCGNDPRRWCASDGWLLQQGDGRWVRASRTPKFDQEHTEVYPQVLQEAREKLALTMQGRAA